MQSTPPYPQQASGAMTYPDPGTFNRLLFKTPLVLWRMGMGSLLGQTILVLTTWGRISHLPRHTTLSFSLLDDTIYLGAGWGERCDWYRNLVHDPHVTIQACLPILTDKNVEVVIPAIARRVTDESEFRRVYQQLFETGGDTHFKPWLRSLGIDYDLEDVMTKHDRIHQVALDLQPFLSLKELQLAGYPPPMPADLKWVWLAMGSSFLIGWLLARFKR